MKDIKDFKFKEFIQQDETLIRDYMVVLNQIKPIANFEIGFPFKVRYGVEKSLTELTFGEVNKLKRLMAKTDPQSVYDSISTAYHYPIEKVQELPISIFYACINFIGKEVQHIIKVENHRYKVEPSEYDELMEQAGIESLNKFGDLNAIDQISNGQPWLYDLIESQPYMTIHAKIWLETEKTNINIRKEELMKVKN